jgi:hypothetical protein
MSPSMSTRTWLSRKVCDQAMPSMMIFKGGKKVAERVGA